MLARSTSTTRSEGTDGRPPRVAFHRRARWREMLAVQAFFLPTVLSFVFLVGVPTVLSVLLSFTNFDGYSFKFHFVGLTNYRALFSDPQITASLYFTILYAVATTVIVTVIAIPLAVVINIHFLAQARQSGLFLHIGAQPLGAGPRVGLHPVATRKRLGQLHVERPLRHRACAMAVPRPPGSVLCDHGGSLGAGWWHAVLYLGYLQSIPNDYQDAALVDGASAVRRFFAITVPLLAPAMTVSVVLLMVGGLRVYELPLALTNGGPVYSTYTVTQNILSYGVSNGEFGEGTALSVVFLSLVIVVLLGSLAVLRHREVRLT